MMILSILLHNVVLLVALSVAHQLLANPAAYAREALDQNRHWKGKTQSYHGVSYET
jgi:hypothetical protein